MSPSAPYGRHSARIERPRNRLVGLAGTMQQRFNAKAQRGKAATKRCLAKEAKRAKVKHFVFGLRTLRETQNLRRMQ